MHVVHVVSSLEVGGQERVVLDLARGIVRAGHKASVVSLSRGGRLKSDFGMIPVFSVSRRSGGLDPAVWPKLVRALGRLSPDVVHTHNPPALMYGAPAAALLRVPRLVHTKHGVNPVERWRSVLARRALVRLYDEYVAVSDATAEVARRVEGVPEDKLTVIANGIDVQAFTRSEADRARVRRGLGLSQDMLVVGSVGRLSPEKNYPLLLRATAELLGPEVRLVLVGDGPERERLSALVAPHVRPFVHFAGMQHDVAAWLSAFDVFALSSYTEGLPLVVPEAMAASLPVVCTAVGGLPGVIADGISGLLVPSGDATAFAEALRALVGSPAARIRYGAAGRDAVERRFSLARVVDAYAELYARGRGRGGMRGARSGMSKSAAHAAYSRNTHFLNFSGSRY